MNTENFENELHEHQESSNLVNIDWELVDLGLDKTVYTLWSDGSGDDMFANNHGCWLLLGTVK